MVSERVVSTRCQSDMRGLVTAGRDFRIGVGRYLESSAITLLDNRIAHRPAAGHSKTLAATTIVLTWTFKDGYSSSTASDQHQPASSRAMAMLATTERFLRSSKWAHR